MKLNLKKILCIAALSMTVGSGNAVENNGNNNDPMQAIQNQIQAMQAQQQQMNQQLIAINQPLAFRNDPLESIKKAFIELCEQGIDLHTLLRLKESGNLANLVSNPEKLNIDQIDAKIDKINTEINDKTKNIKMAFSILNKPEKEQLYQNFESIQNKLKDSLSEAQYKEIREKTLKYWSTWKKIGVGIATFLGIGGLIIVLWPLIGGAMVEGLTFSAHFALNMRSILQVGFGGGAIGGGTTGVFGEKISQKLSLLSQ